MKLLPLLLATSALVASLGAAQADSVTALTVPEIGLGSVTYKGGKGVDLTVGYGSGATHRAGEDGVVYTITDRGPNIDCAEALDLTGADTAAICAGNEDGKVFPMPGFVPTIYRFELKDDALVETAAMPLKGRSGAPLTGISTPLTQNPTEPAFDAQGAAIPQNPNGFDSEALVKMGDGSFWVSDEYGPSIAHVAADGTVLARMVPAGTEGDYAGADYDTLGALPAIVAKRALNRGIESVAGAPDDSMLYFALQSPLANPDKAAYKGSRLVRLFKFDPATNAVVGEFAYQIDTPDMFGADSAKGPKKQNDVKVSEIVGLGTDKLLVLERISKTTKLYMVDLAGATPVPAAFDDVATAPSLEQLGEGDLAAAGVVPVTKTLIFNSDDHKGMATKIEGVALLDATHLLMINDNDFAIEGDREEAVVVTLDKPLTE